MILRFRGPQGMYRVNVDPQQTFNEAVILLAAQLPGGGGNAAALKFASAPNKPLNGADESWSKPVGELGLKHGDLLFFELNAAANVAATTAGPKMAAVDIALASQDGKIPRQRSKLCRHDDRGMCEYCQPLEPYDEKYRVDHGIKHRSLWSEIRRLKDQGNKKLEAPYYGVKSCKNHPPFPASICSACQPQPVSLQLQKFRVVDHVEFAHSLVINNVVDYWRQTNSQRFGFMIGKYEEYPEVPLGVKAVVHAIWEPEQADSLDGIALSQFDIPPSVSKAAGALGLEPVGVLWTDIVDAGNDDGTVLCKRHAKSYFLSSQEVLFSANLQRNFPNKCSAAVSGTFSSKFVTCVISGNTEQQIDVACYQMSASAESLVGAKIVEPSVNPSIVRVKPRTPTLYVPDVTYKQIDKYGNAVQKQGKPSFPTDYLLVSLSHGFSETQATVINKFAIENRPALRVQTPSQLEEQLEIKTGFNSDNMADFHLLVYLYGLGVLKEDEEQLLAKLLKLEREKGDAEEIVNVATQLAYSDGFSTLRMLAA